jgi:ketosteroid isomerase-like protein
MTLSRAPKFFLFVACLSVAGARTADLDVEKAVGSLIAAEKAYAQLAGEKGFREASISVFADDAVIFAPNAVNGKKFWQQAEEDPAIAWRPILAAISRSGQLGYTTGPWEYRKLREAQNPDGFGHFVTIWRKDGNGVWKVRSMWA